MASSSDDRQPYRNPFTGRVRSSKPLFTSRKQYQPTPLPTTLPTDSSSDSGSIDSANNAFDDFTEPPLNVPKSWGGKAKKHHGWMQKILQPDLPLTTVEDDASIHRRGSLPPPSPQPLSDSPRDPMFQPSPLSNAGSPRNRMWNAELDFTAQSLHMSPQLRVRNPRLNNKLRMDTKLEELQRLEAEPPEDDSIMFLTDRGRQISPLDTVHDKETFPTRDLEESEHEKNADDMHDLLRRLSRSLSRSESPQDRGKETEERPIPGNSEPAPKNEERVGRKVKRTVPDFEESRVNEGNMSPKVSDHAIRNMESKSNVRETIKEEPESSTRARSIDSKSDTKEEDPEDRITAEAKLFELQDNKSSRSPSPMIPTVKQTPKVTGAYIETPTPGLKKKDLAVSSDTERPASPDATPRPKEKQPRRAIVNTARPTSAAEDVRRMQGELEDATLDNFADFVAEPFSDRDIESKFDETQTLERINRSMKKTSSSIRDARRGIERLEQQVTSVTATDKKKDNFEERVASIEERLATVSKQMKTVNENFHILEFKVAVPRLWKQNSTQGTSRKWRLTWLGLVLVLLLTWFTAETAMCARFCHPKASSTYVNWHPDDPFFPWAIPTKLDQWTGKVASSALSGLWKGRSYGTNTASDWWIGREGPIGINYSLAEVDYFDYDELV
ncbi:hypothetical protein B0O99DRAFT_688591 [Bisporella sp. PMI_857]|nr:hypothetical protein B0O99DRAFT_688591 [Bisporella sp. PMI_857]